MTSATPSPEPQPVVPTPRDPAAIPPRFRDLLAPETRAFAYVALVGKDGAPRVTPVWFDWDGRTIGINTFRGSVKDRLLSRHPPSPVALAISDPANPYRFLQIRGAVDHETEDGAYVHICDLFETYDNRRDYPRPPGEVRVTYRIRPEHVFAMNIRPEKR